MKLNSFILYSLLFCNITALYGRSVTTLSGTNLNKAIIFTSDYVMTGSDYALGAAEFRNGITKSNNGAFFTSNIGISFPLKQYLRFTNESIIDLTSDIHLDGGAAGSFLLDTSSADADCVIESQSSFPQSNYTIYLDSDVTVSSGAHVAQNQNIIFADVIIDGQGHTIDFSNSLYCGFVLYSNVILKNVTLKNVWFEVSSFPGFGNFALDPKNVSGDKKYVFDNVSFIARKFKKFELVSFGFSDDTLRIDIKNNVLFGNFGQFSIFPYGFSGATGYSVVKINNNSNLTIQDSSFGSSRVNATDPRPIQFWFESNTAHLTLDNSTFSATNDNLDNNYALDLTLTLSIGTIIVNGSSTLQADSLLRRAGRARLNLGNGTDTRGDINIIVNPGAILNLVSTNTNCSVAMQNIH